MSLNTAMPRWPYKVSAGANSIRFAGNSSTSDQTLSTSTTYIAKGETGTGTPADVIDAFQTLCQNAITALWGSGTITVTLDQDGTLHVVRSGGGVMSIEWQDAATTFDGTALGFDAGNNFIIGDSNSPYQIYGAWYPKINHVRDGGDNFFNDFVEFADHPGGIVTRTVANSTTWYRRLLLYDFVPAAVITKYRAASAAYAAYAGIATGDPNAPIEVLVEYMLGRTHITGITFPEPGALYIYDTIDPSTHTQEGPYQMLLSRLLKSMQDVGGMGLDPETAHARMSAETYPVRLQLQKESA